MEENEMVTCEQEFEEMESVDYESTNVVKWMWVAIGSAVAAGIGGAVLFVRNKLKKKSEDIPEGIDIPEVDEDTEEFEEA